MLYSDNNSHPYLSHKKKGLFDTNTETITTNNTTERAGTATTAGADNAAVATTTTTCNNNLAVIIASLQRATDRLTPEWVTAGQGIRIRHASFESCSTTTETEPKVTSFTAILEMTRLVYQASHITMHFHTLDN